jgi:beta-glucosidase-like glycosyl hydrolase
MREPEFIEPGEKPLLPLPKNTGTILVAGSHAHNLGYQCGGWTITWQGVGGNNLTSGKDQDRNWYRTRSFQ